MSVNTPAKVADPFPAGNGLDWPLGRWLFWGGIALSVSAILAFVLQIAWAGALITPWYLPVVGTLAALFVIRSLSGPRSWWRIAMAVVLVALTCLEWFFLLKLTVLPAYTGPIEAGSKIPAFHATLADGSEITDAYFASHPTTALVFFQGRWCPFCMTQLKELEAHHEEFARAGADVAVVSLEDPETAAETKRDFPHLTVVSDQRRELSSAIDLINKASAPDGGDTAAPTIVLVSRDGTVRWLHRPTRFIARPSAAELLTKIEQQLAE